MRRGRIPADTTGVALRLTIAGDAMADPIEAPQTLDVEIDQAAGLGILITHDRLGRIEIFDARQTGAFENAADGGRRDPGLQGNVPAS